MLEFEKNFMPKNRSLKKIYERFIYKAIWDVTYAAFAQTIKNILLIYYIEETQKTAAFLSLFFCCYQKIRQNKPCGGTIYCVIILLSAEYIVGFGGRFCRKRFKMQILEKIRRFFLLYIVSEKKLFAISRRFFCRKKAAEKFRR